jgi:hypothetical protein
VRGGREGGRVIVRHFSKARALITLKDQTKSYRYIMKGLMGADGRRGGVGSKIPISPRRSLRYV